MKHFLGKLQFSGILFLLISFASCSRLIDPCEPAPIPSCSEGRRFYALVDDDAITKSYLDDSYHLHWNADDRISVFFSKNSHIEYRFDGNTGDVSGDFSPVSSESPSGAFEGSPYSVIAVYPYNASTEISKEGKVTFDIPAVQNYVEGSYDSNANIMLAANEDVEDSELHFKNIGAFIELRLYGEARVRTIELAGNNGEILTGPAKIKMTNGTPVVTYTGSGKSITVDCGDGGVLLGASAETATTFIIPVPAIEFSRGFKVMTTDVGGLKHTQSTFQSITLGRNHIQPMAPYHCVPAVPVPVNLSTFSLNGNVCTIDNDNKVITGSFPGLPRTLVASYTGNFSQVTVDGTPQESGVTSNDFNAPLDFDFEDANGNVTKFKVKVVTQNLIPRIDVDLKDGATLAQIHDDLLKKNYVSATISIGNNPDFDYISAEGKIKGRGNATWTNYAKKPYNIKFESKQNPFGFGSNKKWSLLADFCDKSLLRTAYMCEVSKELDMPFSVRYKHVDLYVNGDYLGTYALTDCVEKGKTRVNIGSDGFIIEDDLYAHLEPLWFETSTKNHRFSFKYPDPEADPVKEAEDYIREGDEKYTFISGFMNNLEAALYSDSFKDPDNGYRKYIDVESFAKWYILMDVTGNWEANLYYVLPDHESKLQMYPAWDSEWSMGLAQRNADDSDWIWPHSRGQYTQQYMIDHAHESLVIRNKRYFQRLMEDPYFVQCVKDQWTTFSVKVPAIKARLSQERSSLTYSAAANGNRWSSTYGSTYWGAMLVSFGPWDWSAECNYCENFFDNRVIWLGNYLNSL